MNITLRRTDIILLFGAIICLFAIFLLGGDQYPELGYRNADSRAQVYSKGLRFVQSLGYELQDWPHDQLLSCDSEHSQFIYEQLPVNEIVPALKDSLAIYKWQIVWFIVNDSLAGNISLQLGENDDIRNYDNLKGWYQLTLDAQGRPLHFEFEDSLNSFVPSMTVGADLEQEKARRLARRILRGDIDEWIFEGGHQRSGWSGITRQYKWYREIPVLGVRSGFTVTLQNGRIISFHKTNSLPKNFNVDGGTVSWLYIFPVLFFAGIFIISIVQIVKRLRADLLDFKMSIIPMLIFLVGLCSKLLIIPELDIENIGSLIITTIVLTGMMWALFTLGKSLTREVWSSKLTTFDAVQRRMLFPQTGLNIFRGLSLGLIAVGLYTVLTRLGIFFFDASLALNDQGLNFLSKSFGSLLLIGSSLSSTLMIIVLFCLFIMTLLKKWLKRPILAFLLTWLLWAVIDKSLALPVISPGWISLAVHMAIGGLLLWSFIYFDLITVLVAYFSIPIFYYSLCGLLLGSGGFWIRGIILLGFLGLFVVYALRAYQSNISVSEVTAYVPDYVQRIHERERIQQELEIARHVQLTFLPSSNPSIPHLDIATLCLPAKEVGGDYYDFIISDKSLGIVIGDVSGKGISAAFYMTLTKGFLKANTKIASSPKEILININELFYENAERGMFISMILAFFDLEKNILTFARAGHNPLIHRCSETNKVVEVGVSGIALGLENGTIFNNTIQEKRLPFKPGDEFLFYTDGLNEAQNLRKEEFGEERLLQLIETYHALPAGLQLARIQNEIETFSSGASQHDDMTAVLVKIRATE